MFPGKGEKELLMAKEIQRHESNQQDQFQKRQELANCIQENMELLLRTLCMYTQRMGLAQGTEVQAVALDVLQETVVEALEHAERFETGRQPVAWLLGIGVNVIRRKKDEARRTGLRELSIHHLSNSREDPASDGVLLDSLPSVSVAGPEVKVEEEENAERLLALVPVEDRRVLQLAFIYGFSRETLAQQLGMTPGSVRVKLHRALSRLRSAWREQAEGEQ